MRSRWQHPPAMGANQVWLCQTPRHGQGRQDKPSLPMRESKEAHYRGLFWTSLTTLKGSSCLHSLSFTATCPALRCRACTVSLALTAMPLSPQPRRQWQLRVGNYCSSPLSERLTMNKFRFERTSYGWKAYLRCNSAWLYFGHFSTQAKAMLAFNTGEQP